MKIEELKHNHSLTDLLKILLFAILMLAPALSVATRCLYVIANKNAYQSYYGETINEKTLTNELNNIQINKTYQFNTDIIPSSTQTSDYILINGISNLVNIPSNNNLYINANDITAISMYYNANLQSYSLRYLVNDSNVASYYTIYNGTLSVFSFEFTTNGNFNLTNIDMKSYIYEFSYNQDSYLDNVFEYSVSKLATDQMFTWTANTPVFAGVQAMCSQLGITAPAIPIIIAYWLILTCVYIVIDIVIKLITYLTHLIGARKGT